MTNNLKNSTITIDTLNVEIEKRKLAEVNAKKALQIKSEFTSLVSHELRTPLTAIKEGIAIVYEEMAGKINDEQREVLKLANNNILRLTRLIGDILDFQKLDAGKMEFDFNLSNINDLVTNVQKTMQPLAEKKGLKIELKIENNIPSVRIDKDRIEQVLSNLLSNAIKYTKEGKITIITEFNSRNIKVSVKDTGEGIKSEDMGKIFSSFTRLKIKEHVKKIEGTGLGLYICKKIIDGHLGLINVISNDGKGSVFYLTIPLN